MGATLDQLRVLVPENWIDKSLGKGSGARFLSPDRNPKGLIEFNEGAPEAGDPLHAGPYLKVSVGGLNYCAAMQGNPVLEDRNVPSLQIMR